MSLTVSIYSRDTPQPNVNFTHAELYEENSDEEGMYDCSLLPTYNEEQRAMKPAIKHNVCFAEFHAQPFQDERVKPPAEDGKMPARQTKRKGKSAMPKKNSPNVVLPSHRAHKPVDSKPMKPFNGKSKVGKIMHQMHHTQQIILALMGIDAPDIDLTLLDDDDDDDDDNHDESTTVEILESDPKNASLSDIKARYKANKSKKAADKRRLKKQGLEPPPKKSDPPKCLELPQTFKANGCKWHADKPTQNLNGY